MDWAPTARDRRERGAIRAVRLRLSMVGEGRGLVEEGKGDDFKIFSRVLSGRRCIDIVCGRSSSGEQDQLRYMFIDARGSSGSVSDTFFTNFQSSSGLHISRWNTKNCQEQRQNRSRGILRRRLTSVTFLGLLWSPFPIKVPLESLNSRLCTPRSISR
jgi:hypothetical protein